MKKKWRKKLKMRNKGLKNIALFTAVAMLITTYGCASTQSDSSAKQQEDSEQTKNVSNESGNDSETVINIARGGDTVTMDPIFAGDNVDIWMDGLVFEGLVRTSTDGKNIEPCLATDWDISPDGLTYTFHLKDGVKFSDGTPLKAEDCEYSIERSMSDGAWSSLISCIKEVKVVDDNTIDIILTNPSGSLLSCLASFVCAIYPKEYYSSTDSDTLAKEPIGTGPFYLEAWEPEKKMCFKKNPNYWESGYPLADEVNFLVVPDDNTRLMQLQAGQVDVITGVSTQMRESAENSKEIKIVDYPTTHVEYVSFNYTNDKLKDKRIRQALNYATNREDINRAVFGGIGTICPSIVWPTSAYFNPNQTSYEYNPEKAKELLKEAGATDLELNLIISSGDASSLMEATILKDQWEKVGVTLNIDQMDSAARREERNNLTFEVLLNYFTSDITDVSENMEMFCLKDNYDCWHLGWNGSEQEEAEKLVKEAGATNDDEYRKQNYYKAQEIFADEALIVPLCTIPETVAMRDNVSGFEQGILGNYQLNNLTIDYQ